MLQRKCIFLALLSIILGSCSGPSTTTDAPNTDSLSSSSLRIVAISADTLYWGEQTRLTVNQDVSNADDLLIFIGSIPSVIDSAIGREIFVTIAPQTTSAKIRLYRNDSLARGDKSLTVLEHSHQFSSEVYWTSPTELAGYAGDIVLINGSDFPFRKKDVRVTFGYVPAEVVSLGSNIVGVRITPACRTGAAYLSVLGRDIPIGVFTLLEHGRQHMGEFLPSSRVGAALISASAIAGTTDDEGPSETIGCAMQATPLKTIMSQRRSDSLFIHAVNTSYIDSFLFKAALQLHPWENRVSGVIEFFSRRVLRGDPIERIKVELHEMSWSKEANDYVIYARGAEIDQRLRDFLYKHEGPGATEVTDYNGSTPRAIIEIRLTPGS